MGSRPGRAARAYGGKGARRGVSARSGWRVDTGKLVANRFRAVPRTDTPRSSVDSHAFSNLRCDSARNANRSCATSCLLSFW